MEGVTRRWARVTDDTLILDPQRVRDLLGQLPDHVADTLGRVLNTTTDTQIAGGLSDHLCWDETQETLAATLDQLVQNSTHTVPRDPAQEIVAEPFQQHPGAPIPARSTPPTGPVTPQG